MKFHVTVYSDDGTEVDYSNGLLPSELAQRFIAGWQREQDSQRYCECVPPLGDVNPDNRCGVCFLTRKS